MTKGQTAYTLKQEGKTWSEVAESMGYAMTAQACNIARSYAVFNAKPWPIAGQPCQ